MALTKIPDSPHWHYAFRVNGTRFRGSTKTSERKLAEAIEAQKRTAILLNGEVEEKKKLTMTLDIAAGRYVSDHAHRLATCDDIEWHLAAILKALGAQTGLDHLTDNNLAKAVARWRGQMSDSSVNRRLTVMRAMLRMARDRWGVTVTMPFWKAHRLIEPAPRERYLTEAEAKRLIAASPSHLALAISFSLLSGVRLANCTGLKWSQVNMQTREIVMRVKSRKPGGKTHFLPMSEALFVLLANMTPQDAGPVFTYRPRLRGGKLGAPRPVKSFRRSWYTAMAKAKISDFHWHDLRHTAASWMVQAGVPLDVVQKILAHEHISTTQRYAHRADDAKKKGLEAIPTSWTSFGQGNLAKEDQVSEKITVIA